MKNIYVFEKPSLIIIVISVILAMVTMEVIGVMQGSKTEEVFQRVEKIYHIKKDTIVIRNKMDSIDNSLNGFLLNQDPEYVISLQTLSRDINGLIIDLKAAVDLQHQLSIESKDRTNHEYCVTQVNLLDNHVNTYLIEITKILKTHPDKLVTITVNNVASNREIDKILSNFTLFIDQQIETQITAAKQNLGDVIVSTIIGTGADIILILFVLIIVLNESRKKSQYFKQLQQLVYYDSMTGLPNRRMVFDPPKGYNMFTNDHENQYSAVIMIDLDRFDNVNDTLGHQAGDKVIKQTATRLFNICKERQYSVARLGGDEFMLFVPDISSKFATTKQTVINICKNIIETIEEPYPISTTEPFTHCEISASVGAAIVLGDCNQCSPNELIQQSDIALFNSKSGGRGMFSIYNDSMHVFMQHQMDFERKVKLAVENEEFNITYQPIVKGEHIIGAESLIKWVDTDGIHQNSERIIETAEKLNITNIIGYRVIRETCKQLREWIDTKKIISNFTIAINISRQQLNDPNFINALQHNLKEYRISHHMISLELSESVMLNGIPENIKRLTKLRDIGLILTLDDFGINLTSLAHIKYLPLTGFKIDRSFIKDIENEDRSKKLMKAIYDMAIALEIEVAVEGIETIEQLELLQEQGYEIFQGFLFGCAENGDIFFTKFIEGDDHLLYKEEVIND